MPKIYNFKKIDAFATENSDGNPAGYIRLNSLNEMTEAEMLQIAKELKGFVNEVGYVAQTGSNVFDLRYFSAEREVDFCGHATVAILYDLVKTDASLSEIPSLTIKTNKGELKVDNRIKSDDSVFIMSPVPVFIKIIPDINEIAKKLQVDISAINTQYPVSIINAGLNTLIVPITDLNSILNIHPDLDELKEFCFKAGVDIIEVFTTDTQVKQHDFRTRVFAPTFGYLEDPATGSGNSAFGYYLAQNNIWKDEILTIEQNGLRDRYNVVKLQKRVDEHNKISVLFGGGAITRIEGEYLLY